MEKNFLKTLALILVLSLSFSVLAACDSSEKTTEKTTRAPTEQPTENPTVEGDDPSEKPSEKTSEQPSETPTEPHICEGKEWVVVKDATCTDKGEKKLVCECGKTVETTEIEIIPHNYENYICTGCGDEIKTSNGLEFTSNGDKTCYVSGIGTCTDTDIIIPYISPDGDIVTSIGSYAFEGYRSLTSVEIPDSVTSIEPCAFYKCDKLIEVINKSSLNITAGSDNYGYVACYAKEVHNGDSKIVNKDGYRFYTYDGVNYLIGYVGTDTELVLPENYNSETYEIYQYAFLGNDNIISVVIPHSVTGIGKNAFTRCYNMTNIVIGKNSQLTSIGDFAFSACSSLISVVIPDSVVSIGTRAFAWCYSFTSIVIPNNVTSIVDMIFDGCDGLTIYCEAESQPSGWGSNWNGIDSSYGTVTYAPVVWGYKGD